MSNENKKYCNGVELPVWTRRLTWNKAGDCAAHSGTAYKLRFTWFSYEEVKFIPELNSKPFTDDSWKESKIEL